MKKLKDRLESIIREINELEHKLESLKETESLVAKELLDSYKSDSYSGSSYTIYKKPFYKIAVENEALAKEYMIPVMTLDKKNLIAEWKINKKVKGFKIKEEIKILVRNKNE